MSSYGDCSLISIMIYLSILWSIYSQRRIDFHRNGGCSLISIMIYLSILWSTISAFSFTMNPDPNPNMDGWFEEWNRHHSTPLLVLLLHHYHYHESTPILFPLACCYARWTEFEFVFLGTCRLQEPCLAPRDRCGGGMGYIIIIIMLAQHWHSRIRV